MFQLLNSPKILCTVFLKQIDVNYLHKKLRDLIANCPNPIFEALECELIPALVKRIVVSLFSKSSKDRFIYYPKNADIWRNAKAKSQKEGQLKECLCHINWAGHKVYVTLPSKLAFFHKGQDLSYKCVDNVYLKIYCGLKDDRPDDALYERSGVMFLSYSATGFDICSLYKMKKSKRFLLRSKITFKSHKDNLLFPTIDKSFYFFPKKCGQNCHCCHLQFRKRCKANEPNRSM